MYLQVPSSDVNSNLPHQKMFYAFISLSLFFSLPIQLFCPESDVYGLSSGSGYEAYTPYGRLRAQLTKNGSNNGVFGAFGGVGNQNHNHNHNQKERRMNSHLLKTH